jgi:glycosyltransferase involved in cell wall biosynthesis
MAAVSICIPTYNGALYLEECLASALAQSFDDIEIVVVDDCSTDETPAVVERFAKRDKRIRAFRNTTRLGLAGNWNRSIGHCTGDWIKFLFQDDVLSQDCLREMVRAAAPSQGGASNRLIVCERRFVIEEDAGQELRHFYKNGVLRLGEIFPDRRPILPREFSAAILERGAGTNFVGEPTSVMMRRDLCCEYGFFNTNLIHLCDLEYWTRIGTNEQMAYIPQSLCDFRVHGRSASTHHHAHRPVQVAFLDKIILLHDYLYHPFYENFRKMANCETLLSAALKDVIRDLRVLAANPDHTARGDLAALVARYPLLRRCLDEKTTP